MGGSEQCGETCWGHNVDKFVLRLWLLVAIFEAEGIMKRAPRRIEHILRHRGEPPLERDDLRAQPVRPHRPQIVTQNLEGLAIEHRVHLQRQQQRFQIVDSLLRVPVCATHRVRARHLCRVGGVAALIRAGRAVRSQDRFL